MFVFVYGTLKRGYGNNHFLRGCHYIRADIISGYKLFYSYRPGSFPVAMFTGNSDDKIIGEIWDTSSYPEAVRSMDRLEGVPHMYTREECVTINEIPVNMYVGAESWRNSLTVEVPKNDNQVHEWSRN